MSFYLQSFVEFGSWEGSDGGGGGGGGEISIIVGKVEFIACRFHCHLILILSVNSYIFFLLCIVFFVFLCFFSSHSNDRWTAYGVF